MSSSHTLNVSLEIWGSESAISSSSLFASHLLFLEIYLRTISAWCLWHICTGILGNDFKIPLLPSHTIASTFRHCLISSRIPRLYCSIVSYGICFHKILRLISQHLKTKTQNFLLPFHLYETSIITTVSHGIIFFSQSFLDLVSFELFFSLFIENLPGLYTSASVSHTSIAVLIISLVSICFERRIYKPYSGTFVCSS
jgi:hypothetical protein